MVDATLDRFKRDFPLIPRPGAMINACNDARLDAGQTQFFGVVDDGAHRISATMNATATVRTSGSWAKRCSI